MLLDIWSATDILFCHFGPFLVFYPTIDSENYNLEKMYQMHGDIILLHMCTISEDHMMYSF